MNQLLNFVACFMIGVLCALLQPEQPKSVGATILFIILYWIIIYRIEQQ